MNRRLLVIGIDGPNDAQLTAWMAAGELPTLAAIARQSRIFRHRHIKKFRNERCWDTFLAGCDTERTGSVFLPDSYAFFNESLQEQGTCPPFYALAENRRVCMFDLPAPMVEGLSGLQISGWASELNSSFPASLPATLIDEIHARYGIDPKLERVDTVYDRALEQETRSFSLPNICDFAALERLREQLIRSTRQRGAIALDLLGREPWDLFLMMFPESHTGNHLLWHLDNDFPVRPPHDTTRRGLLEIYRAMDEVIGQIVAEARDYTLALFTLDDTTRNSMDVPSMVLLPELLHRWSFGGRKALDFTALEPDASVHWKQLVWRAATGGADLESPDEQAAAGDPFSWNPANWYRRIWPSMPAFALPSVSDGYIRLNVRGREAQGLVAPAGFTRMLDELEGLLRSLTDPRTGRQAVQRIERIRERPDALPGIPADLIVCWNSEPSLDRIACPEYGLIGPVPYFRSGGHVAHGSLVENLLMLSGRDLEPGETDEPVALEDVTATLLHLLGISPAGHMTGRVLVQ